MVIFKRLQQDGSMRNKDDRLLKRIARLMKKNRELMERNKQLNSQVEKYSRENQQLKQSIEEFQVLKDIKENQGENDKPLRFNMVTVFFAEICGFNKVSDREDSNKLMDQLDTVFYHFDKTVEKYNVQKVKTIGDTFMCAGGIPQKNSTNPVDVVIAAFEMLNFIKSLEEKIDGEPVWNIKMGVHTGPVYAYVQGKRKVNYDVKGDTVNIASRLESTAEPGKIIISVMTYELVKEIFNCDYYGKMPVKYFGDMELFTVSGIKPELSIDKKGHFPNNLFRTKFALIQFNDLQEMILDKLERELPPDLFYHNVKHTVDVVTEVELIGWSEGINDEELLLLKTAALFHDAGHTISYDDHEEFGCKMACSYLPSFGYTTKQIDRICDIIMATKLPPKPTTLLEKIICDSDLDYLGRSDFIPVSNTLFRELKVRNKIDNINEWNKLQIKFISGHQYFTQTARSLREINKQKQIERIKQMLEETTD